MLSNNIKILKLFIISAIIFILSFNVAEIHSKREEHMRIRSLLELVPRFKGRAYSNKININYENNKFQCKTNEKVTPKEFSFLSNSAYSICSDKIYEHSDILAKRINDEVDSILEPKFLVNVNFLNELKQVLYFAYQLAYLTNPNDSTKNNAKNETDKFFDTKKLTVTQSEILDNLPDYNFNLLEFNIEDLKIVNNYLHTIIDFNISQAKQKINLIIENVEKSLKTSAFFKPWLVGNSHIIKYFVGIVWANAINIDFETLKYLSHDITEKLDNTDYQSKIQNIRNIHMYSDNPGVLCIFEFLNLCGLPENIPNVETENSMQIKKDIADKRIMFYNNKFYDYNRKYSFIKHKNWSNLDYLLSHGDIIDEFYNDYHRVYIDMSNADLQKNLANRKEYIQNIITKQVYSRFQQYLQCKSCHPFITFNLKSGDFDSLRKFYQILYPENENLQNFAILEMLFSNLYKNLQIKIDFDNKNQLKNYNTDYAILKMRIGLKNEMRKLTETENSLLKAYSNRFIVLNYLRNSRNVLSNFSKNLFEETKNSIYNKIKSLKKNYV